jgi:hypothetical protein
VPWFYRLVGCHGSLNVLLHIGTTSVAMDQVAMIAKDCFYCSNLLSLVHLVPKFTGSFSRFANLDNLQYLWQSRIFVRV